MTKLIIKEYNWDAAYERVRDAVCMSNYRCIPTVERVERFIGKLVFRKKDSVDPIDQDDLATMFFDLDGFTFQTFDINNSLFIFSQDQEMSQEEYMTRLMEFRFAMEMVFGMAQADEAFKMWTEGDHDT